MGNELEGDLEMHSNLINSTSNNDNDNTSTNDTTNMNNILGIHDRNISFNVYTDQNNTSGTRGMYNIQ